MMTSYAERNCYGSCHVRYNMLRLVHYRPNFVLSKPLQFATPLKASTYVGRVHQSALNTTDPMLAESRSVAASPVPRTRRTTSLAATPSGTPRRSTRLSAASIAATSITTTFVPAQSNDEAKESEDDSEEIPSQDVDVTESYAQKSARKTGAVTMALWRMALIASVLTSAAVIAHKLYPAEVARVWETPAGRWWTNDAWPRLEPAWAKLTHLYALPQPSHASAGSADRGKPDAEETKEEVVSERVVAETPKLKNFTLAELALYDGTDPALPIYIAVMGQVFDVTPGADFYGKVYSATSSAAAYHAFAGQGIQCVRWERLLPLIHHWVLRTRVPVARPARTLPRGADCTICAMRLS